MSPVSLDAPDAKVEKKPEKGLFSSSSGSSAKPSLDMHERTSSTDIEERPPMHDTSEDPNIKHLKKMAETQLQRARYMTKLDFFIFMYEAGHHNRDIILQTLKQNPRIEVTDKGFKWLKEDKT